MFNQEELKFIQTQLQGNQEDISITIKEKIGNLIEELSDYKLNLYKFYWDCGRSGDLSGVFKATQEDVDNAIGKYVYFGEVLGKHSEVDGTIEEGEITLITDDPIKVMNSVESGFDPLEYIQYECVNCGSKYVEDDFKDFENKKCGYCNEEEDEE